jgi:hypothetical protein
MARKQVDIIGPLHVLRLEPQEISHPIQPTHHVFSQLEAIIFCIGLRTPYSRRPLIGPVGLFKLS